MTTANKVIRSGWETRTTILGSNDLLRGDGFYISYCPAPGAVMALFDSDDGGPETALCHDGCHFILNGDFREAYERLVPLGLEACKQFYEQQSAHAESRWSEHKD